MFLKAMAVVCLGVGSFAVAQVTAPRAPRGHSVITRSIARRGYLGVGVAGLTAERAKALKAPDGGGIEVTNIDENGPAARAGVKEGDVILELNGQKAIDIDEFIGSIGEAAPGSKATLVLWRDAGKRTVTATLQLRPVMLFSGEMPAMPAMPEIPNGVFSEVIPAESPRVGFEGEALNPQLAAYFGVKEGVLVRSVTAMTPASKAGLRAGDVITKVSGIPVSNPREISSLVRSLHNKALTFTVKRNHKEILLNVEVAGNPTAAADREVL